MGLERMRETDALVVNKDYETSIRGYKGSKGLKGNKGPAATSETFDAKTKD